jgi:hypothetical protein
LSSWRKWLKVPLARSKRSRPLSVPIQIDAVAVLEQAKRVVVAEAGRVERIVAPGAQDAAVRVEQEQAAAGDRPQVAGAVEHQVLHEVGGRILAQRHR